ncbi:MAG: ATP-binding cassette subfamily B multidrug efflux pump [bacterium]|jgi:ATP-binding cassette subfamily B multidrug efflux pump
MNRLYFLFSYLKRHKFSYIAGIFFIILTNWIMVSIPHYIQLSIDLLTNKQLTKNHDLLVRYLVVMLALAFSMIGVRILSRILFFNPGRAIEFEIKNDLFRKLMGLQKDYYDKNQTGSIISRINNDITGVRLICGFGMMQTFNIASSLSFTPYKMWQISPKTTLYCLIPVVIIFFSVRLGMSYVVKYSRRRMDSLQGLSAFIVSSLSGIDVIKSYLMKDWAKNEFQTQNKKLMSESISLAWTRAFIMPLLGNLENILKVLVLLVGGLLAIHSEMTIGELTAFITYTALLTNPLMGLGWLTTMIQQGMVGLASLETIFKKEIPFEKNQSLPKHDLPHLYDQGIEVKNLHFQYEGSTENILNNISFRIEPGKTVGVLGSVGSGKTTLVNCLNRYLTVEKDQIFIGGKDINSLSYCDLRYSIRTVSQDIFLFSDTVTRNILFGVRDSEEIDTSIDPKEMKKIIYQSALEEEILRFPKQGETLVGEKGIMLSGGQKQRISLARAMTSPCDLLILDNVLSAVDHETERFLLEQIYQNEHARSILLVSHRAKALEHTDHILVLENGAIVDQGTPQELLEKEGFFKQTWELQNQN